MGEELLNDKLFSVSITGKTLNGDYEVTIGTMFTSFDEACEGVNEMLVQIDKKRIPGLNGTFSQKKIQKVEGEKVEAKLTKEFTISSAKLKYTDNEKPFLQMKLEPGFMKFGVYCWEEVFEPYYGTAEEIRNRYGRGKDIPTPKNISIAVVAFDGDKASRVIRFK